MSLSRNSQCLALALLLTAAVSSGCSGSSSSNSTPTPPPLVGASYQAFLPMHVGDHYECDSGLVLRVESTTVAEVGEPGIVRIHIEDGSGGFGFYWSEDADRGTLMHGAFASGSDHKVLLDSPYPIWRNGGSPTLAGQEFDGIQSQAPARTVALAAHVTDPTTGMNRLAWLSMGSLYGTIFQHELDTTLWTLDFRQASGRYPREFALYAAPGFGPLSITLDGTTHSVVRARIDGVLFEQ